MLAELTSLRAESGSVLTPAPPAAGCGGLVPISLLPLLLLTILLTLMLPISLPAKGLLLAVPAHIAHEREPCGHQRRAMLPLGDLLRTVSLHVTCFALQSDSVNTPAQNMSAFGWISKDCVERLS